MASMFPLRSISHLSKICQSCLRVCDRNEKGHLVTHERMVVLGVWVSKHLQIGPFSAGLESSLSTSPFLRPPPPPLRTTR